MSEIKRINSGLLGKKIKGSALYISILVSIVIGIILTLFILIGNYNQRNVTVFAQSSQLLYNLKSAFQIAQSAYFTPEQNYRWIKNEVNDDSIRIKKINWGAYFLVCAETKNRHHYLSQAGLFGTFMSADTGLMISDNSRLVGASGKIVFMSNCYLPKAGIKPAYIEGQSYTGGNLNSGYIRQAPGQVPIVNKEILKGLKQEINAFNVSTDSAVRELPDVYNQSFQSKTIVWEISTAHISNLRLNNNIKLVCEQVEIDSTAHLENILIVCKKARFKKGFRGKVHVIASDSISMEENCEFSYPSSFVLLALETKENNLKYIQFNKGCVFFGGVLALSETSGSNSSGRVFVKLHAESEVNGLIYSSDYIHIEGTINGTVIANKLLLKTPSAVYENHLLSCEINPKKYAGLLAVPLVFKQRTAWMCCERMN